jgi:hypothetical protein
MGHKRLLPSFETPRKRGAPQDDGCMCGRIRKWPLSGPFYNVALSITVIASVLDDHDLLVMTTVPAAVAMTTEFGARTITVMAAAALDYDGFSTCDGRSCDGDGGERRDDISKLLHDVLFLQIE